MNPPSYDAARPPQPLPYERPPAYEDVVREQQQQQQLGNINVVREFAQ